MSQRLLVEKLESFQRLVGDLANLFYSKASILVQLDKVKETLAKRLKNQTHV